jgi:hypothetical protein
MSSAVSRILAEDTPFRLDPAPLAEGENGTPRCRQHLPGAADKLPGDQERDQHVGQPAELAMRADLVTFPAAPGTVLDQVDIGGDTRFAQPPLGVHANLLQDPLARLVVRDEVEHVVALRRRVFRVAGRLHGQPRPVPEQDVAAPVPGYHGAEDVAR